MKELEEAVRDYLLLALKERAKRLGFDKGHLSVDCNLFEVGIVDSMAFIEIVSELEKAFGVEIDFEKYDPSDLSSIVGLSACVVESREAE